MKSAIDRYRRRASAPGPDPASDGDRAVGEASAVECDRPTSASNRLEIFHDADSWRADSASSSSVVAYLTGARTRRTTCTLHSTAEVIHAQRCATVGRSGGDGDGGGGGDEKKGVERDVECCEHEAKTGAVRIARAGVYRFSAAAASRLVGSGGGVVNDRSATETRALFVRLDAAAASDASVAEPVATGRDPSNVVASCVAPVCRESSEVDERRSEKSPPAAAAHPMSRAAWTRLEILAHTAVLGVGDRLRFLVSTTADPPAARLDIDPTQCEATIVYCGPEPFV